MTTLPAVSAPFGQTVDSQRRLPGGGRGRGHGREQAGCEDERDAHGRGRYAATVSACHWPASGFSITGGAGFIGTTLARRLVDANEVVALDNLHRDALSGTELAEHPELHVRAG